MTAAPNESVQQQNTLIVSLAMTVTSKSSVTGILTGKKVY